MALHRPGWVTRNEDIQANPNTAKLPIDGFWRRF
jgi:hypothetical protein